MGARTATKKTIGDTPVQRAMTSQINWAILGLVIEAPGYGYDLMQRFEKEYGDVLDIGISSIYSALKELTRRGFVEEVSDAHAVSSSVGTAAKPPVRATADGMRSLEERLLEFAKTRDDRRQQRIFLRQLAVFAHEPEVALRIIGQLEQAYADEARMVPIVRPDDSDGDVVSGLVARLAAEESRLARAGKMPWISYARREFEALAQERAQKERLDDGPARA